MVHLDSRLIGTVVARLKEAWREEFRFEEFRLKRVEGVSN
jgi:hypothetical protein